MKLMKSVKTIEIQHGKAYCSINVSYRGYGFSAHTSKRGGGYPPMFSLEKIIDKIRSELQSWIAKKDVDAGQARTLLALFEAELSPPVKQLSFWDEVA